MYKNLKKVLMNKGISKLQLAMKANINPATLYDIFNGKRPLYPEYKKRIAEALEMTEDAIFGDEDD